MSETGNLIKQLRDQRGWTQHKLASETGIAQSIIASYEGGRHEPKISTLNRILKPLHIRAVVTIEYVWEGDDGQPG